MKKAVCFIILLAAVLFSGINVYAEGEGVSASLQFSKIQVQTGEQLIVTVNVNSEKDISEVHISMTYDPSLLTFVSANGASGSNGIVSILLTPGEGGRSISIPVTFNAAAKGSCAVNVISCSVTDTQGAQLQAENTSGSVEIIESEQTTTTTEQQQTTATSEQTEPSETTTTKPATDKNGVPTQGVLVDLQVDQGSLVPPFMYSIHDYSMTVPYEVDKVEIEGKTASKQDHIWYTGNSDCVVGHNVRTITVTDINGKQTVYTINIIRLDKDEKPEQTSAYTNSNKGASEQAPTELTSSNTDSKLKNILNPALYIVLIVLIIALFIVILWIRSKISKKDPEKDEKHTQKQRSKIKVSGGSKKKK